MPNIGYLHPSYTALLPRWEKIRDCISGSDAVKARTTTYLPKPNASDTSAENDVRYEQYVTRAIFYNVTAHELNSMVGQVMTEDPAIKLPSSMEVLEKNVDGAGVTLVQQVQKALEHDIAYGRAGIFVDFPRTEGATSVAQVQAGVVRPNLILLEPWDITNWRMQSVNGTSKLTLVVIAEQYVTVDDGFEQEYDDMWRVLRLDEEGLYVQEEWIRQRKGGGRAKGENGEELEYVIRNLAAHEPGAQPVLARYQPTDANGKRINYLPFQFIGVSNNDANPDLPPLYDMAELNIGHYRNSADYEEAAYIAGQPTPWFSNLTEDWVKNQMQGTVELGSRAAILLPEGGAAGLLQPEPNIMPKEAMAAKELQMAALGARLVNQNENTKTATQSNQDNAAETSTLAKIAKNVSAAYNSALIMAQRFLDRAEPDESEAMITLNTNYRSAAMAAPERAQLANEWMSGAITDEEYRHQLKRAGIATEDFETWQEKREEQADMKRVVSETAQPAPPLDPNKAAPESDPDPV